MIRVVQATLEDFEVALPQEVGGQPCTATRKRRGVMLSLVDTTGTRGRGEASPLPGYSRESLDDVRAELERFCRPSGHAGLVKLDVDLVAPSARAALDSAVLDLSAKLHQRSAAEELAQRFGCPLSREPLELSRLLPLEKPLAAAEAAYGVGYRTFKVKECDPRRLPELLGALRSRFADRVRLRVDVNRRWSHTVATSMLARLEEFELEFVEEPVDCGEPPPTRTPIAWDESLPRPFGAARVVVVKPTLHGLFGAAKLALAAQTAGLGVVVTHTFEGPVGHAAAGALAWVFGSRHLAQGLDWEMAPMTPPLGQEPGRLRFVEHVGLPLC